LRHGLSNLVAVWQKAHISWILVAILAIAVMFYGLHDNGIIIGYTATAIIMFELTKRWRKIRNFIILSLASLLAGIFLSFLHEVVVAPAVTLFTGLPADQVTGFRVFSDTVSLLIIFFGVTGIIGGLAGAFILGAARLASMINRHKTETNA
jgi:hypothetical protein